MDKETEIPREVDISSSDTRNVAEKRKRERKVEESGEHGISLLSFISLGSYAAVGDSAPSPPPLITCILRFLQLPTYLTFQVVKLLVLL
jgi:hypothetical protein